MEKFKRGLVIGKFYPPHKGHNYLINFALERCEEVTVILCWNIFQTIPYMWRVDCLKEIHPGAKILTIQDGPADDDSEGWAKITIETLGFVPDVVFTSEEYGDPYAKYMGCKHVLVDKARTIVPCSGTMIRSNPLSYLEFMEPCVRAGFIRRVVLVGAESTGKTTLAKALGEHYKTNVVEEYGREYSEKNNKFGQAWTSDEFTHIAEEQIKRENLLLRSANKILICDTDSFATTIWHRRYMNSRNFELDSCISHRFDGLYFLTDIKTPFEQDGTRDGEAIRQRMHEMFIEDLDKTDRDFHFIKGRHSERVERAIKLIDALLLN